MNLSLSQCFFVFDVMNLMNIYLKTSVSRVDINGRDHLTSSDFSVSFFYFIVNILDYAVQGVCFLGLFWAFF